jgi:hypothetical protein
MAHALTKLMIGMQKLDDSMCVIHNGFQCTFPPDLHSSKYILDH